MVDFDPIAAAYDALIDAERRWSREAPLLSRLLEEAGERKRRVLDMGCGTGFHAIHLARELAAHVSAADPAVEMLSAAQVKIGAERVHWFLADAAHPPAGPFDLVLLLGNTLSLIKDVRSIFVAAASVAVPQALFMIQQLDYESLRSQGEQSREKQVGGLRIVKVLTPLREPGLGARLLLRIFNENDELVGETRDVQRAHESQWIVSVAAESGWSLLEERRSYEDADRGSDRIHIFRRSADPPAQE